MILLRESQVASRLEVIRNHPVKQKAINLGVYDFH